MRVAAFSNVGSSKLNDVENDAKFRLLRLPVKISGEDQMLKLYLSYDQTSGIHLMAIHCAALAAELLRVLRE